MDREQKLQNLIRSLLFLHKDLLDYQRADYEKNHGSIATSGDYFSIVVNHADFTWLRSLSEVIALIDEAGEAKTVDASEVSRLAGSLKEMLKASGADNFSRRFAEALKRKEIAVRNKETLEAIDDILTSL